MTVKKKLDDLDSSSVTVIDPAESEEVGMAEFEAIGTDVSAEADGWQDLDIPPDDAFLALKETDLMDSPLLAMRAGRMIDEFPQLVHLQDMRLKFAWKRKGGTAQGQQKRGGVIRGNTALRLYAGVDFIIWLAADTCRGILRTELMLDAALFHELKKASVDENEKPFVQGPDLAMFEDEVEIFGLWSSQLQHSAVQIAAKYEQRQLQLND